MLVSSQRTVAAGAVEFVEHIVDEPPLKVIEAAGMRELAVAADTVALDTQAPQPRSRALTWRWSATDPTPKTSCWTKRKSKQMPRSWRNPSAKAKSPTEIERAERLMERLLRG